MRTLPAEENRFPALDGLRGLAALLVIFHHLGLGIIPEGHWWSAPIVGLRAIGWIGVDLFFVLSGFLITGILIRNREAANYFSAFYAHRALRIFPPMYLLLVVYTVIFPVFFPALYARLIGPGAVWPYWTFLANMRFFSDAIGMAASSYIGIIWTLSIEEQYYIGWSVAVRFLKPARLALLAATLLVGGILLRSTLLDVLPPANPQKLIGIFCFTLTHLDGLCVGTILRVMYDTPSCRPFLERFGRTAWIWAACYGIGLWADFRFGTAGGDNWSQPSVMRFGFTLIALFFGALLISGLLHDGRVRRLFDHRWLRRMGAYSYCMYLIHIGIGSLVVWALAALGLAPPGLVRFCLQLALIIAVAHFSYFWFERPLLALKRYVPYRQSNARTSAAPA